MSDPNKPLGKQNFENLLSECMPDKKLSVDLIRSAYITHMYNKPNFTIAQRNELAKQMRHSRNIAELSYQKMNIPSVINEDEEKQIIQKFLNKLKPKDGHKEELKQCVEKCVEKHKGSGFDIKAWGKTYRRRCAP